jgi:methylaspartate mutase sigma subunit
MTAAPQHDRPVVVLGVIGSDIHVVANRILAVGLAECGYRPHNLGTHNELGDFVAAARETGARAVLIASLNGDAESYCRGARAAFAAAGRGDVLLYLGGNLSVGHRAAVDVERTFLAEGFDRVFHRPPGLRMVFDALGKDLAGG